MLSVMNIPASTVMPQDVSISRRESADGEYEWAEVTNLWSGNPDRFYYAPAREVDGEAKRAFARVTAFHNPEHSDQPVIYSLIFFDEDAEMINEQLIIPQNKARFRLEGTFNLREYEVDGESRYSQDIICKSGAIVSIKPYYPRYNGGKGVGTNPEAGEAQFVSDMAHEDDVAGPVQPSEDAPF